ncbi:MAG: hypothetical protein ACFB9M_17360 [Myxococcota bacterium]
MQRFGLLLAIACTACASADLRPPQLRTDNVDDDAERRGRLLLQRVAEAYGVEAWEQKTHATVVMTDVWEDAATWIFGIWDARDVLRIDYRPGSFDAHLEFIEGPHRGGAFGMEDGRTYRIKKGKRVWDKDPFRGGLVLPALLYLTELPFRLLEAGIVVDAGEAEFEGRSFLRILATWQTLEPNDFDQYLVWIDPDTLRIHSVDYTVRAQYSFITATVFYEELREVDGVWIPFLQTISERKRKYSKDYTHQIRIQSFSFLKGPRPPLGPAS